MNEILDFLISKKKIQLSGLQVMIILKLVREIYGWGLTEKSLSQKSIAEGISVPLKRVNPAINELAFSKIIKMEKVKGKKHYVYSFNEELFGRKSLTDEPKGLNLNALYIPEDIPKMGNEADIPKMGNEHIPNLRIVHIPFLGIRKTRKLVKLKRNSCSKDISKDNLKDISLGKFSEFLKTQVPSIRRRWEKVIPDILKANPSDDLLLLIAIEMVHRTKKDFMGQRIHRSIVGLFEKMEWSLVRDTVLINYRKEKEREEMKKTVEEVKKREVIEKSEQKVDIDNISPLYKHYAFNKGTE